MFQSIGSWMFQSVVGGLLALPQQFVAAYGWPGLAALLATGILGFKLLKKFLKPKPEVVATVVGLVLLLGWWFWPSRSAGAGHGGGSADSAHAAAKPGAKSQAKQKGAGQSKIAKANKSRRRFEPPMPYFSPGLGMFLFPIPGGPHGVITVPVPRHLGTAGAGRVVPLAPAKVTMSVRNAPSSPPKPAAKSGSPTGPAQAAKQANPPGTTPNGAKATAAPPAQSPPAASAKSGSGGSMSAKAIAPKVGMTSGNGATVTTPRSAKPDYSDIIARRQARQAQQKVWRAQNDVNRPIIEKEVFGPMLGGNMPGQAPHMQPHTGGNHHNVSPHQRGVHR
jgi:hypothetical protein